MPLEDLLKNFGQIIFDKLLKTDFFNIFLFDSKTTKREEDFPLGEAIGPNLLEEGKIYGLFFLITL
jgi:hypothetical protein